MKVALLAMLLSWALLGFSALAANDAGDSGPNLHHPQLTTDTSI
jgi:hypothetical protein